MFSFGIGDFFFPMLAFNFTLLVTANFLGLEPLTSANFLVVIFLNIPTILSLYYTYLSKEKAEGLSLDKDLHGIPITSFLFLAACFFLSLLVFFEKVEMIFSSFLFIANIFIYLFYTLACFHNFKKLSRYIKCPVCNRLLYNNCDYCDRCGEPLSKKAQKEQSQNTSLDKELPVKGICPKCKSNLLVGSKFCSKCGYHLPNE